MQSAVRTASSGTGPLDELPDYQVARLFVEFFASVDEYLGAMFPNRLVEGNAFLVVARSSLPDWARQDRFAPPHADAQATIRTYAIATSLQRSPETLRRHTGWLIDKSFLVQRPGGLAIAPDPANAARVVGLYARLHDLFLRFVDDIASTTDYRPEGAPGRQPSPLDILSRTMDAMLATLEPGTLGPHEPIGDSIWCLINALNVRGITYDPMLARRFAETSVPDGWRRPVSLTAVANVLRIPYTTIWRKTRVLEERGLVRQHDRGWIVPQDILAVEAVHAAFIRHVGLFVRKMRELERLGLSNGGAGPAYLTGRPAAASAS